MPPKRDILFFRGDFDAVTLEGTYSPTTTPAIIANGGATITSGRWNGLFIPYISGANTTPPTMIMSPQIVVYWSMGCAKLVDVILTCHAERNYSHMTTCGTEAWTAPGDSFTIPIAKAIAFGKMIKSWGFYNVIWKGDPFMVSDYGPLVDAGLCDFACIGEEIDSKMAAEQLPPLLNSLFAGPLNGVPSSVHFTAGDRGGYPIDPQRDTFLAGGATGNWADYDGRLHLALQSNQNHSAGRQAACTVYARQRLAPAPNSKIILWETMATDELEDPELIWTEEVGCLRSLELLYAPGNGSPAFGGSNNGLRHGMEAPRFQNGSWV